jgi:pimeloyl-ACP methyl ester carboxylesterase
MARLCLVLTAATTSAASIWAAAHMSSPAVQAWAQPSARRRTAGPLNTAITGDRDADVILLLHGLGATGDYFGSLYDDLAREHLLVIPDLLGFGRSLRHDRTDFSPTAHLDALDEMFDALDLGDATVTIGAHSMGSAIALRWAQRHPTRARGIVLFGPPIYSRPADAVNAVGAAGPMAQMFLLDTDWAHRLCRFSCSNRRASGAVMAALSPRLPIPLARQASLHTWEAYRQSIINLVIDADWPALLSVDAPVTLVRGECDRIGDIGAIVDLATDAQIANVARADHHVAITHSELGRAHLDAMSQA